MELLSCPEHTGSYCMLKTGTRQGPHQGVSFYMCGKCKFIRSTSLQPVNCSRHQGFTVELQSLVSAKSADHLRRYFRCHGRKAGESWCGYEHFPLNAAKPLKDYNYQDTQKTKPSSNSLKLKEEQTSPGSCEENLADSEHPEDSQAASSVLLTKAACEDKDLHDQQNEASVIIVSDEEEDQKKQAPVEKKSSASSLMDVSFADLCKSQLASSSSSTTSMDVSFASKSFKEYRESPHPASKSKSSLHTRVKPRCNSDLEKSGDESDLEDLSKTENNSLPKKVNSSECTSKSIEKSVGEITDKAPKDDGKKEGTSVIQEVATACGNNKISQKQSGDAVTVKLDNGQPHRPETSQDSTTKTNLQLASGAAKPADVRPKITVASESLSSLMNKKTLFTRELQKIQASMRVINIPSLPDKGQRILDRMKTVQDDIAEIDAQIKLMSLEEKNNSNSSQASKSETAAGGPQTIKMYPGPNGQTIVQLVKNNTNQNQPAFAIASAPTSVNVRNSNSNGGAQTVQYPGTLQQQQQQQPYLPHLMHLPPHMQQLFAANPQAMTLYGGRMTAQRLQKVGAITTEAIDKLHKQLETCPTESTECPDPEGLKVTLMPHQRQALAWLAWREQQHPAGGILADDMGLGKTLTTISHILRQKIAREDGKDEWLNREKQVEKLDKAVKKSRATLIIAPASVVHQWAKEIERRCRPGILKFLVYHGPNRERSIHKLIDNDIVLTTYTIISKEVGVDKTESAEAPAGDAKDEETETELKSDQKSEDLPTLLRIGWERIVLDEAHNIKNHKSQTAMSICRLRAMSRWALTGTPIQNDLLDMYSLLRFLRFSPFDEYKVWKMHVDSGKGNTKRLNTIVKALLLRRTKQQTCSEGKPLVSLPSRSSKTIEVELTTEERTVYEKLFRKTQSTVREYVQRHEEKESGLGGIKSSTTHSSQGSHTQGYGATAAGGNGDVGGAVGSGASGGLVASQGRSTGSQILVLLLRLRQCCSHLSLMKSHLEAESLESDGIELTLNEQMKGMMLDDITGDSSSAAKLSSSPLFHKSSLSTKLKCVMDKISCIQDGATSTRDKSVIVSQWTQMLEIVAHHLAKAGIEYSLIQGDISAKKRMDIVDDFNTNPRGAQVLLLSLRAGGVGLNLVGGNHLFLLDNHWNPALEEQACDRIYRMGQKKDVFIYRFLCKDTIEEKIVALQERKLMLAKSVLSGTGAKSQKLTLNDLRLLFGV